MKTFLLIISLSLALMSNGQSLERTVINSGGSAQTVGGVTVKSSVGESIVGKRGDKSLMLSQGFYTGSFEISTDVVNEQTVGMNIFPNPFQEQIYVKGDLTKIQKVEVYNQVGEKVYSENLISNTISLKNLTAGFYFINLLDNNHQIISSSKLIKLSL